MRSQPAVFLIIDYLMGLPLSAGAGAFIASAFALAWNPHCLAEGDR